jgi:hypothetical protein
MAKDKFRFSIVDSSGDGLLRLDAAMRNKTYNPAHDLETVAEFKSRFMDEYQTAIDVRLPNGQPAPDSMLVKDIRKMQRQ